MSIFDTIFGKNSAQQQQQQQPPAQQQQQQPNPHVATNPTVPGNPTAQAPAANPNPVEPTQSPNDKFAGLWENVPKPGNEAPNFKINPEQLNKVTSGLDFTKSINREDLAKIANGGEEAIAALSNVLNTFGQSVFGASAQFSSHMTESGYNMASQTMDRGLPGLVTKQLSANELYASNPKLRDPALQPLVSALQTQFATKHPNATPQEINSLVTEYLGGTVAGAFTKPEPAAKQGGANPGADFSGFLG